MRDLSIMLKPASSLCNMRCKYCFYHSLSENRENFSYGMMSEKTAENAISRAINFAEGGSVYFAFQGGEPLLRGIDFFQRFAETAQIINSGRSKLYFALQTNGTLIDDEWARFFKENGFLVGLSLDGGRDGNRFRLDADYNYSYPQVMKAVDALNKASADYNILSVATGYLARNVEDVYRSLTGMGFKYLQFIPSLRPFGDKSESDLYMNEEEYGDYLIRLFNLYVKDYVRGNYVSIRQFDNMVRLYLDMRPEQCGTLGHCSHQFVIEGDGSVFPCDFYCLDEWLLGNINNDEFKDMANSKRAKNFIKESLAIPDRCRACGYYKLCRGGGCKRSRADRDYCDAYKRFFSACLPLFRVFKAEALEQTGKAD